MCFRRVLFRSAEWWSMADMLGAMGGGMARMTHGAATQSTMSGMSHDSMAGMNHGSMQGMNHAGMSGMNHAGMSGMDHRVMSAAGASIQVRHARTEYGASTDMRVDMPRTNLDDPSIGLRNNGRRVLTLSDLHTVVGAMDTRGAEREIELHLTG